MNSLKLEYTFADFMSALAFINQVAKLAEEADHHPDVHLTGYKHVMLELTTHSAGGTVTQKDRDLAAKIESLVKGRTDVSAKSTSNR